MIRTAWWLLPCLVACSPQPQGPEPLHRRHSFSGTVELAAPDRRCTARVFFDRRQGPLQLSLLAGDATTSLVRGPSGGLRAFAADAWRDATAAEVGWFELAERLIEPGERSTTAAGPDAYRIEIGGAEVLVRLVDEGAPHGKSR